MFSLYTARKTKELFGGKGEFAVLDVREQEEFARGHMILASCAPLSRLECMVEDLAPCKQTPVVLVDSGVEPDIPRAVRAASVLSRLGYSRLIVLEDGMEAWKKAGFMEFTGVGALGKGFGEYVEEELKLSRLGVDKIKKIIDSDTPSVVIDVRPRVQLEAMSTASSVNAPGCEIAYHFADLVPDPKATVIMSCAGDAWSAISTQTLRNAGIRNKIVTFKNGEMPLPLRSDIPVVSPKDYTALPSPQALRIARKRAERVAQKYGVAFADADQVLQWKREVHKKTLYLFDVRQPEEFSAGHIYGSRNVPGGQLMYSIDEHAAVRNARYVLIDDTEVRAVMTAHWLNQMGLPHVYVLKHGLGGSGFGGRGLAYGPVPPTISRQPRVACVSAPELKIILDSSNPPLLLNIGASTVHRKAHIPGALWVTRYQLECAKQRYPQANDIVITADNEVHGAFGVADAERIWPGVRVRLLTGGTPAWIAAEFPVAKGMPTALCAEDDSWYTPYTAVNVESGVSSPSSKMGPGIIERIKNDGDVRFALVR